MVENELTPLMPESLMNRSEKVSFITFLKTFWPMSLISFGGPPAHVALMHEMFVDKPRSNPHIPNQPQIEESTFLELFSLSQSLPGPGSTQLASSLGATFGGAFGAFITFFIWHLPGFIAMSLAGIWFHSNLNNGNSLALIETLTDHAVGLVSAAFAYVLIAAFKIVNKNCSQNHFKMIIALISLFVARLAPPKESSWVFIAVLILGGVAYSIYDARLSSQGNNEDTSQLYEDEWTSQVSASTGIVLLSLVGILTVIIAFLPSSNLGYRILQIFWRIGLTVFGGGIIVIPMLIK